MKPIAEESESRVISVYDGAATTYNRVGPSFFLHFGKRLANGAGIVPESKVLDVATGTGAVLMPAAERVGAKGQVVGVDISSRMIDRARTAIRHGGLRNANVLVGDAERLPFQEGCFDYVLCSFAIFLFANLSGFISECHRSQRPPVSGRCRDHIRHEAISRLTSACRRRRLVRS
jgi:ubiquinone/menaquinone biosynthesis C-methylase UbiE